MIAQRDFAIFTIGGQHLPELQKNTVFILLGFSPELGGQHAPDYPNAVENMDLPEDSESAIAKGLHLLLCNEYLLTVKKKSPVNKAVECADLLVYKSDWNKILEHERRERFIYIPVQIQIERKKMSFN
ncbi:MAG: hypothetical protein GX966_09730 [Jeotgalicoccus halophilus]|nr:hypothetical protein [Jeotgalicoccus aerolatus]